MWRYVTSNLDAMQAVAPDGYEPACYVYLAGREDPIVLASVESRADTPWLFLANARDSESDVPEEVGERDDLFVFAREDAIQRVELAADRAVEGSFAATSTAAVSAHGGG